MPVTFPSLTGESAAAAKPEDNGCAVDDVGSVVLSPIETQRAIAILDETIEKLSFLGSITPDVLQHRDELSKFVGDEISHIIYEQRQLEARYEELIAQRGALKGLANKSKYKEVQCEIQDVSRALRESTKNLCRNLKDNPNISDNLVKIQQERTELIEILAQTVREMQESGTFKTLVMKVHGDKLAQDRLHEIIQREKDMAGAVKQLDGDLNSEKREHANRVADQKAEIARLKEQLQSIKSKTTVDAKYFRKEAHAMTSSILRTYRQAERAQETTIKDSERKLEMENVVHKETVDFLKRKQESLSTELAEWTEKYAQDYGRLEEEYTALKEKQLKNRERLDHLQARKAAEEEEARKAAEEAVREAELEKIRQAELVTQNNAASKIQRIAKRYLKRVAERAAAGAKKKGKKGKKKK